MPRRYFLRRTAVAGAVLAALATTTATGAADARTNSRVGAGSAIPVVADQDVMPHLRALQAIADRDGGNRAHGTKGYRDSVVYVRHVLEAAGYHTTLQPFEHAGSTGWNLIADLPGGDTRHTVMLGAHLDSVEAGPGINDNGSGAAAVLATAVSAARTHLRPQRHLRFAWWGAEEGGLFGSAHYVDGLNSKARKNIDTYVNFDQAGSKNTSMWLVVHGEQRATDAFESYFADRSIPTFDIGDTGSDDQTFANAGIPIAGFTTGISDCIHSACDDIANVDPATEIISTNAIIGVTWELASRPKSVTAR